ncbi:MAG: hypothetical protein Q3985_04290 [Eubacteriales bacterium]|nr:hypothetical protein [Eubacteriales bacterium]
MSREYSDELHSALDAAHLLDGIEPLEGEEYSLDAILAEFGQGEAEPAQKRKTEETAHETVETSPETAPETAPVVDEDTDGMRALISAVVGMPAEEESAIGEEEPTTQKTEIVMDRDPGEPEGNADQISLAQVMSRTVEAVLEQDDEILEAQPTLRERLAARFSAVKEHRAAKAPILGDTEELWDHPETETADEPEEPQEAEPDMEQADRDEKRRMKKLRRQTLLAAVPVLLVVAASVLHELITMPAVWLDQAVVRCSLLAGLLVLTGIACADVWKEMGKRLANRRASCELAAALAALVSLADCVQGCATGNSGNLPFAAVSAVLIWLCQYGLLLESSSRRAGFHLANLGGTPPYTVSQTSAGMCKQKGLIEGFYRTANGRDPARIWQSILVPLLLSAATVLAGVVCLSGKEMSRFLWVWSAMLSASVPLSLPLTLPLPLYHLSKRLNKSGSAVAGYQGAKFVSRGRRMVLTDNDIFPPGTVSLNGLKVFGEEIGKVASYAATVAAAAGSQLSPLFDQLLAGEGGVHRKIEDLHFYEEGGVGGTIRGETVTMGSAYFMKKSKVVLPRDLKLKTGVFLAVDGVLVAIFAIKYQPSRNVEWALRALRRNRIEPVLAVRSGNITPSLLKRKFNLDVKPIYPDVSTRLALSDACRERGERADAVIYREGLMPFAETVIGSRRLVQTVKWTTILAYVGGVCGLLLSYYFTHVGNSGALSALYMMAFLALWLLPTWLLSGLVKHY